MAKLTVELGELVLSGYDLDMLSYPIFDEAYRTALNAKIIEHFYFREIGFETAGKFKRYLNMTLNEIMPLYNQAYNSELLVFDPLHNTNLSESDTRENSANNTTVNNNTVAVEQIDDTFLVSSDTPGGLIDAADIKSNLWASQASRQDNKINTDTIGTSENTAASNALDLFVKTVAGNSGISNSQLLNEFRSTFLNIDMQVIHDLDTLFMGIYL